MTSRLPAGLLAVIAQAQLALMLLTRLPAGRLVVANPPPLAQTVWAYPLVGALVGGLAAGVLAASLALGLPAAMAALLAVGASIIVTGGLHEDGLADVADGFGGGHERARKLEIMRDSRIGSYGTLALILGLGLRVLALAALGEASPNHAIAALIAIEAASRAGLAVMLAVLPSARGQGLGHAAAGGTPARAAVAVALGSAALGLALGLPAGAVLGIAIAAGQGGIAVLAMRHIGGQTGDVLGAAQQIGAMAALIAAVALMA